jgi:hypothetical protein
MSLPRICLIFHAGEMHGAFGDAGLAPGQESHDGQRRDGLARSALSDQSERPAGKDAEADVFDDREPSGPGGELDPQVLDGEELRCRRRGRHARRPLHGSRRPLRRDTRSCGGSFAGRGSGSEALAAQRVAQAVGHQIESQDGEEDGQTGEDEGQR